MRTRSAITPPALPRGGVMAGTKRLRPWRWPSRGTRSEPVGCRAEQWYVIEARRLRAAVESTESAAVQIEFEGEDSPTTRFARIEAVPNVGGGDRRLAWIQTPPRVRSLRLIRPDDATLESITLFPVIERGPKCHPMANAPRWDSYRPPFPIERVYLPKSLAGLRPILHDLPVEFLSPPQSLRQLVARVNGSACVLDPAWIVQNRWKLKDIETAASASWLVVDLVSLARLVNERFPETARIIRYQDRHEIYSARIEYADVQTRGCALFDVAPCCSIDERGRFEQTALRNGAAWRKFADERGFATLLSNDSPWESRSGHVLSAACAIGAGELTATDLPWLVADGRPLLAPAIARHLLRMHLGAPLCEGVQFWNRWDESDIVLRDMADLARRYAPLEPIRWASPAEGVVRLGLAIRGRPGGRMLVVETGRVDQKSPHAGVPPEAMAIFMKNLAREIRERTAPAPLLASGATVVWQFDSAAGTRHATAYVSAQGMGLDQADALLRIRQPGGERLEPRDFTLPCTEGVLGDRSLELQASLQSRLMEWLSAQTSGRAGRTRG